MENLFSVEKIQCCQLWVFYHNFDDVDKNCFLKFELIHRLLLFDDHILELVTLLTRLWNHLRMVLTLLPSSLIKNLAREGSGGN